MESKVWNKIQAHNLVYGGTWEDAKSSIRAKVFGYMVDLAKNRIQYYQSDLYHDALWINENIVGPMSFDWIARESGTHIGEVCLHVKDDDWTDSARYRFDIRVEGNQKWVLDIYESVLLSSLNTDDTDEEYALTAEYHPFFSNEPLPQSVVEAVANQEVNPINELIDVLFEPKETWIDRHAALDISLCDVATTAAGCIYHPAPAGGWKESLIEEEIPTLRNDSTEFNTPFRKENKMESIIRDLRDKYEEASNSKDQLEEYQSNINDAIDELDIYMSDLDDLISSLDSLPEVSVYVDLDTVSFDS